MRPKWPEWSFLSLPAIARSVCSQYCHIFGPDDGSIEIICGWWTDWIAMTSSQIALIAVYHQQCFNSQPCVWLRILIFLCMSDLQFSVIVTILCILFYRLSNSPILTYLRTNNLKRSHHISFFQYFILRIKKKELNMENKYII